MVRYVVAAIVGCLYVAGSVWLVRSQGESYRESLHQERLASLATESRAPDPGPAETDEGTLGRPSVGSRAGSGDPRPTIGAGSGDPRPTRPAELISPKTELAVKPAETTPLVPPSPSRPAHEGSPPMTGLAETRPASRDRPADATAATVLDAKTGTPKLDAFWRHPALTKSWDLAHLKSEEEIRLGQELHDLILQFNRPLETGSWQRRVEEAAEPFLKNRDRKEIPYSFTILDSNAVSAFSTPGGFVYVCRGLFDLVGEDEDYALEFVVGHEIAHVDLGHALRCLKDPGVMKLSEGTLQKLYWMIIPFGYYPDDLDYQADAWSYRRMRELARTDRESLAFLRKLEGYAKESGFENGRGKPKPGRDSSPIENHFRAHPAAWKRLKQLKAITGKP